MRDKIQAKKNGEKESETRKNNKRFWEMREKIQAKKWWERKRNEKKTKDIEIGQKKRKKIKVLKKYEALWKQKKKIDIIELNKNEAWDKTKNVEKNMILGNEKKMEKRTRKYGEIERKN